MKVIDNQRNKQNQQKNKFKKNRYTKKHINSPTHTHRKE